MLRPALIIVAAALAATACAEPPPRQDQDGARLVRACAGGRDQLWADKYGHFLVSMREGRPDQVSQVSPAVLIDEVCPAPYL